MFPNLVSRPFCSSSCSSFPLLTPTHALAGALRPPFASCRQDPVSHSAYDPRGHHGTEDTRSIAFRGARPDIFNQPAQAATQAGFSQNLPHRSARAGTKTREQARPHPLTAGVTERICPDWHQRGCNEVAEHARAARPARRLYLNRGAS